MLKSVDKPTNRYDDDNKYKLIVLTIIIYNWLN
jgi:hypothetical protein